MRALLTAAVVLTLAAAFVSTLSALRTYASSQRLLASQRVGRALNDFDAALLNAETGQRGFLITGKETYLTPYNAGVTAVRASRSTLDALVADGLLDAAVRDELLRRSDAKLAELAETVEMRRTAGAEAAREIVLTDRGRAEMMALRDLIAQQRERVRTHVREEAVRLDGGATLTLVLTCAMLAVAVAVTVLGWNLQRREIEHRRALEVDLSKRATELQAKTDALIEANEDLRTTTVTLEERSRALKRSNEDLELFAYAASHDLQEPLRMVATFTQLIARRYRGQLDANADEFIGYAVGGAQRMQALIAALLDYSRLGSDVPRLDRTDCERIIRDVFVSLQLQIAETGATVTHDPLPTVEGDGRQLARVFQNLVSNALKFRRPDTAPVVRVTVEPHGAMWRFGVHDNGIGVSAADQLKLFKAFTRLHSREEFEGTGIGLAMCKRIVERHGGRIGMESSPNVGTTLWFTLPQVPAESEKEDAHEYASLDGAGTADRHPDGG